MWGDMPYKEAAQPAEFTDPAYDTQLEVHTAVLALLDEAIANFTAADAADEFFDGSFDFAFAGDTDMWIAAAHTLKARILLNWAKVDAGKYAQALTEANSGISSAAGNWQAHHSSTIGEEFIYRQWDDQRPYARAGKQIVDMLIADSDPRLEFYFGTDVDGVYRGSGHGEYYQEASWLNLSTWGSQGWDFDMVSWEENQFIIAECQYNTANETGALTTLNATLDGITTRWAAEFGTATIATYTVTGTDVLAAIMNEKYKTLYLNPQVLSDWRRTGYPVLTVNSLYGTEAPRRFLYPEDEVNTNNSFPDAFLNLDIFDRNQNDPQ